MSTNRIVNAVLKAAPVVNDLTQEKQNELHGQFDLNTEDFCMLQEQKTLAVADGRLSPEEGQWLYCTLGNTPSVFNRRDLATKMIVTKLMAELFGVQV